MKRTRNEDSSRTAGRNIQFGAPKQHSCFEATSLDETESINKKIKSEAGIKQAIRKLVWFKYVGSDKPTTKCYCCNVTPITFFDFECGHVMAKSKGGKNTVENLRPICGLCNRSMGSQHMFEFQEEHGLLVKKSTFVGFVKSIFGF